MIVSADIAQRMQGVRTSGSLDFEMTIWDVQNFEWVRHSHHSNRDSAMVYVNGSSYYLPGAKPTVRQNYTVSLIKYFPNDYLFGGAYVPRDDDFEPKTSVTVLHVPYRGMLIRWPSEGIELLKVTTICGNSVRAAMRGEIGKGKRMCKVCERKLAA